MRTVDEVRSAIRLKFVGLSERKEMRVAVNEVLAAYNYEITRTPGGKPALRPARRACEIMPEDRDAVIKRLEEL